MLCLSKQIESFYTLCAEWIRHQPSKLTSKCILITSSTLVSVNFIYNMSKKYTLEQLESFVENFAKCFFVNASLCFKIKNSKTKNKFYLYLMDDKQNKYAINGVYDREVSVSLNSHFEQRNPFIMLRDGITVAIDDLVEKFDCDRQFIYKQIVKSLKSHFEEACQTYKFNGEINFYANPNYKNNDLSVHKFSCHAKTFDEFKVQVDLNVK